MIKYGRKEGIVRMFYIHIVLVGVKEERTRVFGPYDSKKEAVDGLVNDGWEEMKNDTHNARGGFLISKGCFWKRDAFTRVGMVAEVLPLERFTSLGNM